ncbi:MerR family transcriptional regulator [Nocardia iowensis]|uniref:MerR family transcriptional regulator n=1 Tax=Nocardia iowensis TaxID=204891 RepID=A0ABX8RIE1_NOCIO|nr:MerR family transcriptional regulator [Nocardia iowensis]QXN89379.1 MerR family transcriptional regulator [Nocardia iowensis]
MRIGELARRTGATTRALRYYEEQGLIEAERGDNGYREYSPAEVTKVLNVRMLLAAGLTSDDIRQIGACLSRNLDGVPACSAVVELYERRLASVEERIDALVDLRDRLRAEVNSLTVEVSDHVA